MEFDPDPPRLTGPAAVPVEEDSAVQVEEDSAVQVEEDSAVPVEEDSAVPVEEDSAVQVEEDSAVPVEEDPAVPVEEKSAVDCPLFFKGVGIGGGGSGVEDVSWRKEKKKSEKNPAVKLFCACPRDLIVPNREFKRGNITIDNG